MALAAEAQLLALQILVAAVVVVLETTAEVVLDLLQMAVQVLCWFVTR
jgi:hypothetical protein